MSPQQRHQAVRVTNQAVRTLVNQGGLQAVRAVPKIVRSVKRVTASNNTPVVVRPKVLQRTVAKVASRPQLVRRLARPSPRARQILQAIGASAGYGRSLTLGGPATITISIT
jgi:hypothetical protein